MEGDTIVVINPIHFYLRRRWRIHNQMENIHGDLRRIPHWKVNHVNRDANMMEHHLAHWAAFKIRSGGHPFYLSILRNYHGSMRDLTPHRGSSRQEPSFCNQLGVGCFLFQVMKFVLSKKKKHSFIVDAKGMNEQLDHH